MPAAAAVRDALAEDFTFESKLVSFSGAEYLQVRDGRVARSTIVVDGADFMAFMGG